MKRVILLSAILFLGFVSSDLSAQRSGEYQRRRGREENLSKDKFRKNDRDLRDDRFRGKRREKFAKRDRFGREVRVVNRNAIAWSGRSIRNNGWASDRRPTVYYDYDFRRGRKIRVNRGLRPSNRHIWVSGYWQYNRRLRRDVWVGGHWSLRRSYHRWVPAHYQIFNGAKIWIEGCWTVR